MKKIIKTSIVVVIFLMTFQLSIAYAAEVGQQLPEPEEGWKRIDDRNANISYGPGFVAGKKSGLYEDTYHQVHVGSNHTVKFNFTGDKIRILSTMYTVYPEKVYAEIDGKREYFDINSKTLSPPVLVFDKDGLGEGEHELVITQESVAQPGVGLVIDAFDIDFNGEIKPYHESVIEKTILDLECNDSPTSVGKIVNVNLTMDNIKEIAAEDVLIEFDMDRLELIGIEEIEGIKLMYSHTDNNKVRMILASEGESNIINQKETLLKFKFKAKATGKALIDITNGRIADGKSLEKDLLSNECGEIEIIIEKANEIEDVDKSGEYTLLDLSIDARYLRKSPSLPELSEYNTDVVINNEIDMADLDEICRLMRENSNYLPNNY